ncbi:MAG: hypothetical protein ACRCST_04120 [Turicibacter sp.]
MNKIKQNMMEFMEGRYGADHLTQALVFLMLFFVILGLLVDQFWLTMLSVIPLVLSYIRVLSKNKVKRHQENILFLKYWYPIQTKIQNYFKHLKSLKTYRYYKCKACNQKLRVPRGKGKLAIKCPKCHTEFIKKT